MNRLTKSAGRLALMVGVAAVPIALNASMVTVDLSFTLAGDPGTVEATYDSTAIGTDANGSFANDANGLTKFEVDYNGNQYEETDAIDFPVEPELFLPGDINPVTDVAATGYGFLGLFVVPGTTVGNFGTVLFLDRLNGVFLASGVDLTSVTFDGTGSFEGYHVCPVSDSGVHDCPNLVITRGVVAPEPAVFPVLALGLAGLWFARRRVRA